jgi:hypothetical protein
MHKPSFHSLLAWAWLATLAWACTKATEAPGLGTNTNWLKRCNEQAECGEKDACLCGMCTQSCESDTQCGAVHEATRCEPLNEAACGSAEGAPSAACLQGCQSNADCSAVENGRCTDGLCVPGPKASAQPGTGMTTQGFKLTRVGDSVEVTNAYTSCATHGDCALVGVSCNGCCDVGAIRADLEPTFEPARQRACAGYQGPQCDCDFPDVVARCEQGACRTVMRNSLNCYSPTQNLERAYASDAVGCRCSIALSDASICVDNVALFCEPALNGWSNAWSSGLDGPCEPRAGVTCTAGKVHGTPDSCLTASATCYQLPNGQFCGLP